MIEEAFRRLVEELLLVHVQRGFYVAQGEALYVHQEEALVSEEGVLLAPT